MYAWKCLHTCMAQDELKAVVSLWSPPMSDVWAASAPLGLLVEGLAGERSEVDHSRKLPAAERLRRLRLHFQYRHGGFSHIYIYI